MSLEPLVAEIVRTAFAARAQSQSCNSCANFYSDIVRGLL